MKGRPKIAFGKKINVRLRNEKMSEWTDTLEKGELTNIINDLLMKEFKKRDRTIKK